MARPKTLTDAEKKNVRVSLMLTPPLYSDVNTLARLKGTTVNELIYSLVEQLAKKNRPVIDDAGATMKNYAAQVQMNLFEDNL